MTDYPGLSRGLRDSDEGEGHVSGIKGRTMAHLSQKDPEILFRVRELFGGSIIQVRMNTPLYCHAWKLCGDRGRRFLQAIYPYLSARRKMQLEKAGAFRLTGKVQQDHTPMSDERRLLRAAMTEHEKAKESYRNHRKKNIERVRATQRAYQARKRAEAQAPQMIQ